VSWARHSKDSDVYVYGDGSGSTVCCCACRLHPTGLPGDHDSTYPETYGQALDHFLRHVAAGHKVPRRVFDRLIEQSVREAKKR
jgi:hypothetical protein